MKSERGIALILALLFLSFFAILGGALLATSTIDIWISDNYKTATQNLYLTEAGIDHARENLRTFGGALTELLSVAAGADGTLSTAVNLNALLASDDQPLIPSGPSMRTEGETLTDGSGRVIGRYHVWLRNDYADGRASAADTNQVLTLLSFGRIGNTRKAIEVTVKKASFPTVPAAVMLDGPVDVFDVNGATLMVEMSNSDDDLDPRLKTVNGLENLVAAVAANAAGVYNPAAGAAQSIGAYGAPGDYRVAVVNGDVELGPGAGYGILVARGDVNVVGSFSWTGLIVIVGQGVLHWNAGSSGTLNGAMLLARTRANDRGPTNPLGSLLAARGGITADFSGAAGLINYDTAAIQAANRVFPYTPIAIRER